MSLKPWAIYTRVSTSDQAEQGVSLDAQLTACRAFAVARSWTVATEYSDPGASAASLKRPGMQDLLIGLRSGKVAGVIAWRLDRLTRSIKDLLHLIDLTNELDVGLVSVTESLDTTSPMGRFVVHLLGAIAQWERETIGARVKSSMAHAKAQGFWMGHAVPAGCAIVSDGNRKRLTRGQQAEIVGAAWQWVLAGATLRDVAKRFNSAGVLRHPDHAGKAKREEWTPATARSFLLSPQVIGILVDPSTHGLVRNALAGRSSPIRRGADRSPGKRAAAPSPLASILRCPSCDAAAVQVTAHGKSGKGYRYFRCTAKVKGLCQQKDLRCEPIESEVIDGVRRASVPGGEYHQLLRAEVSSARGRVEGAKVEKAQLMSQRDQLSARISQLTLKMQIGAPGWDEAMRVVGVELEKVDRRLAELQGIVSAAATDEASLDMVMAQIADGCAALDRGTIDEQTVVLRQLLRSARIVGREIVLDMYQPSHAGGSSYKAPHLVLPTTRNTNTVKVRVERLPVDVSR